MGTPGTPCSVFELPAPAMALSRSSTAASIASSVGYTAAPPAPVLTRMITPGTPMSSLELPGAAVSLSRSSSSVSCISNPSTLPRTQTLPVSLYQLQRTQTNPGTPEPVLFRTISSSSAAVLQPQVVGMAPGTPLVQRP